MSARAIALHNQAPEYALEPTPINRDPRVATLRGTKYGAAAFRCDFDATVVGRSQAVRQRILIPPCEGSIPSAPANICQYPARRSILAAHFDYRALAYSRFHLRGVAQRYFEVDFSSWAT
jgi:hypothetical protein